MENQPPTPIRAATVAPLSEEEKALRSHYAEEQRKTPARLEEAAKYLSAVISVCLTIFIDKKPPNLQSWTTTTLTIASLLWLGAVIMAFVVMFPMRYAYASDSPDSLVRMHTRVVRRKWRLLLASVLLFVAGFGFAIFAFWYGYVPPAQ